jgi:hypothetical protein
MQARPNKTVFSGMVREICPEPDGWGAMVNLEVMKNESPCPDDDFLRPAEGSTLKAFTPEPERLKVGDVIRAQAQFNAGPTGGRAVLQDVKKFKE